MRGKEEAQVSQQLCLGLCHEEEFLVCESRVAAMAGNHITRVYKYQSDINEQLCLGL